MPQPEPLFSWGKSFAERLQRLYRRSLRPQIDPHIRDVAQVLRAVPLFDSLSRRAIHRLADAFHVRTYKKDEYIYRERDPSLGMYVIKEGRIRLIVEDEQGELHELKQLGTPDVFGRLALLGDFRRQETAQAVTETTVLGFFRPELKSLIKRDPQTVAVLLSALTSDIARRYVNLCDRLVEKEGKLAARRMMDAAGETSDATTSAIVRT